MIRVWVDVEEPQATAMNCEDARDGLPVLVGAHIGLTEWALLEAHLKQCAECREAEAHLRQLAAASRPVTRPRAVLASLRKAMELLRIGVTCCGLGITRGVAEIAHLGAWLAIPLRLSVAGMAKALEAVRLITRSVKRRIRFGPSIQAGGVVLALAFTLYALPRTDGIQQLAHPPAPPRPELGPTPLEPAQVESARLEPTRLEPAQAEPAQLGPSLPAPSIEKKTVSVKKTASAAPPPRQSPSVAPPRAAALSPPDVSASEPVRGVAPSPPTLASEPPVSASHVVGQLSAKNPRAAQRDFIALLADVGGTELGRSHQVMFTAVEVVVPQSRYNEFADGLARIGSWRLEAARYPLPDAVHMTIRVTE
jgi:hypothetical protein